MRLNWNFLGGWGCKTKTLLLGGGGGMDIIFWNCTLSVADNNKKLILVNGKCLHLPKVNYNDIITKILLPLIINFPDALFFFYYQVIKSLRLFAWCILIFMMIKH